MKIESSASLDCKSETIRKLCESLDRTTRAIVLCDLSALESETAEQRLLIDNLSIGCNTGDGDTGSLPEGVSGNRAVLAHQCAVLNRILHRSQRTFSALHILAAGDFDSYSAIASTR